MASGEKSYKKIQIHHGKGSTPKKKSLAAEGKPRHQERSCVPSKRKGSTKSKNFRGKDCHGKNTGRRSRSYTSLGTSRKALKDKRPGGRNLIRKGKHRRSCKGRRAQKTFPEKKKDHLINKASGMRPRKGRKRCSIRKRAGAKRPAQPRK